MDNSECLKPKRASGTRNRKRKFTGNMHTRKISNVNNVLNESASGKKIGMNQDTKENRNESEFSGYRIFDIALLFSHLENFLSCKTCGENISLKEEVVCGLLSKISVNCDNCAELCSFRNSKMTGPSNKIAEVNLRCTYAVRSLGLGYAAMKLFCGLMDLPKPVSKKSYNSSVKKMQKFSSQIAEQSMNNAAREEIELTNSSCIDISGDGTWKTRGHTSRIGVCTVIGDKTGKVIDIEVLSSFCKACDVWKSKKGTPEYAEWESNHEEECLKNHTGSAGKMELVGMVNIFKRSEAKRNVKYTGYIGDGDAKTFSAITDAKPYGSLVISKIECVGHIQKRMGSRLRKLRQSKVKCSDNKSVGGKGRLTDKVIDQLTIYYGNAIRQHKDDLSDMRKAVWAVYFHTRSTDSEPLHSFCPPGRESWCKYNKAVSGGTVNNFTHKVTLPVSVMDVIKPIFSDLSHPKLLSRCLGGKTQNNNESINALLWKLCPKIQGVGKRIVEIAANEAVILFNDGNIGKIKVMERLGLTVGINARKCLEAFDNQRIATAELRFLQNTKEARKSRRRKEKIENENFVFAEGECYSAGGF